MFGRDCWRQQPGRIAGPRIRNTAETSTAEKKDFSNKSRKLDVATRAVGKSLLLQP